MKTMITVDFRMNMYEKNNRERQFGLIASRSVLSVLHP